MRRLLAWLPLALSLLVSPAHALIGPDKVHATSLELGAAGTTDTTLTRCGASLLCVEGVTVLTTATGQPLDADLTAIAGLSPSNDDIIQRKAGAWTNRTMTQLSADLDTFFLTPAEGNAAYQPLDADLTSWAGVTRASGFDTFAATPSSANLRSLLTDEVDTGVLVFLGTPADDQVPVGDSASDTTWRSVPDSDGATQKLQYDTATNSFSAGTDDDVPDAADYSNLTGGTGITNSPTGTINFDATELTDLTFGSGGTATIAFTFNLSGTDPVLTAGSSTFAVTGTLTPEADNTRDFGSAALTWATAHITSIELANGTTNTLTASGGDLLIEGVTLVKNTRTITSGNGLTGGGDLSADRTLDVGAGTCITSNANDVAVTANCIGPTQIDETANYAWSGDSTVTGTFTFDSDAIHIFDTNASHDLILTPGSDLTADRVLTLTTGDAARTITLTGNPTLADWFDQSVKTTAGPTFDDVTTTDDVIAGDDVALSAGNDLTVGGNIVIHGASTAGAGYFRWYEDADNGSNYVEFIATASIGTNRQCILADSGPPIPDSCVGDGTDDTGAGGGDAIRVEDGDNGGTFTGATDPDFEDSGDINFVLNAAATPDEISAQIRADAVDAAEIATDAVRAAEIQADAVGSSELDEAGNFSITGSLTLDGDALHIFDTNASHDLIITPGSDLTADRVLTITTGDRAHTIDFTDPGNQDTFWGWDDSADKWEALTAAEAIAIIETVDGSGSGLDADLLDGNSSAAFQTADGDLTTLATAFSTASASAAAWLDFAEDTDNGTNRVRLSGAQSTADVTVTLPAATGTLVLESRTITSGNGLTGGGDLSSDRTLAVGAGTCITSNADDVAVTADCIGPTQIDETAAYTWSSSTTTVTGVFTFDSDAIHIFDTNASHDLILTPGSDLTADRVFTLTTGDAARTLTISANATLNDADYGDITTSSSFTVWNIDNDVIGTAELDETANYAFSGNPTVTGTMTFDADAVHIFDTNASHDLILTPGSDLTADRVLTLTTGDAARTITLNGNPTLNDWFDQSVKTTAAPTFDDVTTTDDVLVGDDVTLTSSAGQILLPSDGLLGFNDDSSPATSPSMDARFTRAAAGIINVGGSTLAPGGFGFLEDADNGSNFKRFVAPSAITADTTCTLEDDANFIPDSCVGNGVDDSAAISDGDKGDITVSSSGTVWDVDPAITVDSTADAVAGVVWTFEHSDPTPDAGDDPFEIVVNAGDDQEDIARLRVELVDDATTTEDAYWAFTSDAAGANTQAGIISPLGWIIGTGTTTPGAGNLAFGTDNEITGTTSFGIDIGGTDEWDFTATALTPLADGANDIGTGTTAIDDLFLDTGSVINFDNGDCTITHSANLLAFAGGCTITDDTGLVINHTALLSTWEASAVTPGIQGLDTSFNKSRVALARFSANSAVGGVVILGKSRGGTIADYTVVNADDDIGSIEAQAADGTDFAIATRILSEVDGTPGAGDMPGRIGFWTSADGSESPTLRMTIKEDGNVIFGGTTANVGLDAGSSAGIQVNGTGTATSRINISRFSANANAPGLHFGKSRNGTVGSHTVVQSGDAIMDITAAGNDGDQFIDGGGIAMFVDGTPGDNDMPTRSTFFTTADGASSSTSRLTIKNDGGIQTGPSDVSPGINSFQIDANGDLQINEAEANGDNFKAQISAAANTADTTCTYENDANFIPDSCVGDGSDASDGRLKDIQGYANPDAVGAMIDRIQIYDYVWTADSLQSEDVRKGKRGFGPVAQELYNINPDWVTVGGPDPVEEPWDWKPEKLVPYLIAETQSLRKRVKEIESKAANDNRCIGWKTASGCIGWSY